MCYLVEFNSLSDSGKDGRDPGVEQIAQGPRWVDSAGPCEARAWHCRTEFPVHFLQATLPENSPQILCQIPQDRQQ